MELQASDTILQFVPVKLHFSQNIASDLFATKNNKTLAETLQHHRYASLLPTIQKQYPAALTQNLGDFLKGLKANGDSLYRKFLNKYGDEIYCKFTIQDPLYLNRKGLYCFAVNEEVKYIGKTVDTFKKRINLGYGTVHAKNCYLDGQATNCHLNSLIALNQPRIEFYLCPLQNNIDIGKYEDLLIKKYDPEWNIMLKAKKLKIS
jgi:hypothetical protein